MSIEPITPSQVNAGNHIPDFVIEAFNQLVTERYDGASCATVRQDDVVTRILQLVPSDYPDTVDRQVIFNRGWLNVEGRYRVAGWKVEFDKPAYNENYGAFWRFIAPRRASQESQ